MLIPITHLPMSKVSGIIHVGAHEAEELKPYLMSGIRDVIWIEPNPDKADTIKNAISKHKNMYFGGFAAGSRNQVLELNIASNGQSSSILELGTHSEEHPEITYVNKISVTSMRIDDWLSSMNLRGECYNFMNLDIQGYELEALKGATKQLHYTDYIYTEINANYLYKDCVLVNELDTFLDYFGFQRIATVMTQHGWGDALYFKTSP
jgi:FkbM family methyltransferase